MLDTCISLNFIYHFGGDRQTTPEHSPDGSGILFYKLSF